MSLRTQAVSIARLFAACTLAAIGFHAQAQTSETPSMTSTGVAGFHHVGEAMSATATVSTLTTLIPGGDVTFTVLDATKAPLYTPCSAVPVMPTGGVSASAACGPFNAPTTAGGYYLRMTYSGAGGVNTQTIDEFFTVGRYFSNIVYTGIDNVFSPAEKVGVTKNIVATVQSSGPTPTGNVTFDVRTSPSGTPSNVCTVALNLAAQAACNVTFPTPGYYEVLIAYAGDGSNEPSGPVNPFIQIGHTVVTAVDGTGIGSLRDAINAVNGNCASSTEILFAIPGGGPHEIAPATPLPGLLCSATVDGYSQSTRVSLSGLLCGAGCNGLQLTAGGAVQGLAIHSFQGAGLVAQSGLSVYGNHIGTNAAVAPGLGNGIGIRVTGGNGQIGGSIATQGNLIVGNGTGIAVEVGASAHVEGNTIGSAGHANGTGVAFHGTRAALVANSIRDNSGAGVIAFADATGGLVAVDNTIYGNGGLAIDLQPGTNRDQAAPVLSSAISSGGLVTVSGSIQSAPPNANTSVTVELYANSVARSTGTGGESLVHFFNVTLDASGFGTFTQTFSSTTLFVSALATVESCAPPSLTGPIDLLRSPRRAKARSVSSGCPVTSEFTPTVTVALLGPAITFDAASLSFSAAAGSSSAPQAVTLTNTGNQPLTFNATPFTFPVDYVVTSTCPLPPTPLAVAASCQVTLTFNAPATPGTAGGVLKVNSDAVNSASVSVALTGTSMAPPSLALSPASLAFGNQDVGTVSAPQAFTITNAGSFTIDIVAITSGGDFSILPGCPAKLLKGASCSVDVKFAPTAAGARNGTVNISASDGSYTVTLGGNGTVPLAPAISATPASLAFANRTLGTVSPAQVVTVTNTGTAPLLIAGITVTGDYAFTSACPAVLAPGASCAIDVKFTPLVAGPRAGSLAIGSNAPGSPTLVALSGVGVDVPVGTLDVSPLALDFAAQPLGVPSAPQLVQVTNVGSATVFILDIRLSGDFAFGDTPSGARACGGPLAPADTCMLAVTFAPAVAGNRFGTLHIASDGTNFAAEVALAGFGVATAPQRALDVPAALSFGPQPFGTRSAGLPVIIANRSSGPVVVSDIDAGGDFSVTESCATIPAGGSCVATVFFTPSARGDRSGTLTVRIQSETLPYRVALSGVGAANPVPILSIAPTRVGFGNTFVGSVSDVATITLGNVGEAPLLLDGFTVPGDFTLESHCGTVIPAGTSCSLEVRFFPRMLDARGGLMEIRSNAAGAPHYVDLSGTGCSIPNVGRSRIPQLLCGP